MVSLSSAFWYALNKRTFKSGILLASLLFVLAGLLFNPLFSFAQTQEAVFQEIILALPEPDLFVSKINSFLSDISQITSLKAWASFVLAFLLYSFFINDLLHIKKEIQKQNAAVTFSLYMKTWVSGFVLFLPVLWIVYRSSFQDLQKTTDWFAAFVEMTRPNSNPEQVLSSLSNYPAVSFGWTMMKGILTTLYFSTTFALFAKRLSLIDVLNPVEWVKNIPSFVLLIILSAVLAVFIAGAWYGIDFVLAYFPNWLIVLILAGFALVLFFSVSSIRLYYLLPLLLFGGAYVSKPPFSTLELTAYFLTFFFSVCLFALFWAAFASLIVQTTVTPPKLEEERTPTKRQTFINDYQRIQQARKRSKQETTQTNYFHTLEK